MKWTCQQLPISQISIWLNAFIPKDIPGTTRILPDGTGEPILMVRPEVSMVDFLLISDHIVGMFRLLLEYRFW